MATLSRRVFLNGCGLVGVGAMSSTLPLRWEDIYRLTSEQNRIAGGGILVLVTLYGGNDGLSTVIPYAEAAYYEARPDLAYDADKVVKLDRSYALNPGMAGLGRVFDQGSLAIVRGAGYPEQDRSHFRSMDIWQTGSLDSSETTGWIGRLLDTSQEDPIRAINIGNVLPVLAVGSKSTAATLAPEYRPVGAKHVELMSALAESGADEVGIFKAVRESYGAAAETSNRFASLFSDDELSTTQRPEPDNVLAAQLGAVSRCIRLGLTTTIYSVSLSGFDTHADEKNRQQKLLETLDGAISNFLTEMSGHELGQDVVVVVYSEFGRRVAANASDGTDHGTSGPVLIAGVPVRGGYYGDDPSLTKLKRGDLETTTDFRDIYAELLGTLIGTDPAPIVGSKRKSLGFLK